MGKGSKETNPAVRSFTEKVQQALQGDNTAKDIQKAVQELLEEIQANIPDFKQK